MTFNEALNKLIYGVKIRRPGWSAGTWIESNGDSVKGFCISKTNEKIIFDSWTLTDKAFSLDDVLADDWEVYR